MDGVGPGPETRLCPLLSTPERTTETGKLVPAVRTPCLGSRCAIYRTVDERCSLFDVPIAVDDAATHARQAERLIRDAMDSLGHVTGRLPTLLEDWSRQLRSFRESTGTAVDGLQTDLDGVREGAGALAASFRENAERQAQLLEALEAELGRQLAERRRTLAGEAIREAAAKRRHGDWAGALRTLEAAAEETGGGTAPLLNELGAVRLRLGRRDAAEWALREAIDREPGLATAHVNLGLALAVEGETAEAETTLRRALDLNPTSASGWNTLGNLLFADGRRREGIACWTKALALDPGLECARENLRRQQVEDLPPGARDLVVPPGRPARRRRGRARA